MDHKGGQRPASAAKLHFSRLPRHQYCCIPIHTFLWRERDCCYVTVSTPLLLAVHLLHWTDGCTFPLRCQSEKPSQLNAWLGVYLCLRFIPAEAGLHRLVIGVSPFGPNSPTLKTVPLCPTLWCQIMAALVLHRSSRLPPDGSVLICTDARQIVVSLVSRFFPPTEVGTPVSVSPFKLYCAAGQRRPNSDVGRFHPFYRPQRLLVRVGV
jgi:hypothetical protein